MIIPVHSMLLGLLAAAGVYSFMGFLMTMGAIEIHVLLLFLTFISTGVTITMFLTFIPKVLTGIEGIEEVLGIEKTNEKHEEHEEHEEDREDNAHKEGKKDHEENTKGIECNLVEESVTVEERDGKIMVTTTFVRVKSPETEEVREMVEKATPIPTPSEETTEFADILQEEMTHIKKHT